MFARHDSGSVVSSWFWSTTVSDVYPNGQYSRTIDGYFVLALAASTIRMILPSAPFSPNC